MEGSTSLSASRHAPHLEGMLLMMHDGVNHFGEEYNDDNCEMQGVLCMPPRQIGCAIPDKTNDTTMDLTAEPLAKEINQSDSGIFSSTANSEETGTDLSRRTNNSENDTDNRSDCSSPDRKYLCPICETMLTSQHEFTLHIRSHNNDTNEIQDPEKGYTCRICFKVLSSSSSLDRHVLVHSGERPFTCRYCGDTFTTNGNMHRHMRTHKSENYESDESESSGSGKEYNNNKVEKRKCEDNYLPRKRPNLESFKCPICERDDFLSIKSLEMHLEDNHPDYPAKCHQCNQVFKNNKILNAHRSTVHAEENGKTRSSVVGFKDLTFVDFSCEKYPHIARYECEKNLHKAASGLKFQCSKCSRAFPCDKSLEIHAKDCGTLDLSVASDASRVSESEIRRSDFFARLDLQDNSPEKPKAPPSIPPPPPMYHEKLLETIKVLDNSKDLADIQSIISITSNGSLLQHLQAKNEMVADPPERTEEEESQDLFAQEFRKMKLRGEFPCRLCTAVFPNLRALKGHNRTHLNSTSNGTYRCNMCPHSSIDKAALIRHMRSHNGDRPYECSLCNYAFTTKANCERHLRNRHAKSTREEVKKSIIYHPSEDPTYEDMRQSETKKLNCSLDSNDMTPEKLRSSTPKNVPAFPDLTKLTPEIIPSPFTKFPPKPFHGINDIMQKESLKPLNPPFFTTSTPQKPPKIQVKNLEVLKEAPEYSEEEECSEEQPIDLSKRKPDEEKPEDLTKKNELNMTEILAQQLLKNAPKIDHNLYAPQFPPLYRNAFPAFPFNPLMFQPPLIQDPEEVKQRLQRFQLCGGGMIMNDIAERLKSFYPGGFGNFKVNERSLPSPKPQEDIKPLTLNIEPNFTDNKLKSPIQTKPDLLQSPNSVKMVIKNGVLMPKQKQRRYRTERPFSCEHCSARFTLRSNMERHIKQQHPQYWSQRQRSSVGNPGRKPQLLTPVKNSLCEMTIPTYEPPKHHDYEESKDNTISDKLKYAILAQHLRAATQEAHPKKEEDEECALVIDEKDEHKVKTETHQEAAGSKSRILEEKLRELREKQIRNEMRDGQDLVPVSRLLDNASQQPFREYFRRDNEEVDAEGISEEDEEGLVASGSTSEGNSGSDENRSESDNAANPPLKKKSAYSLAPNRVSCPYCSRKFPWTSSLRRHILTHTGQKPFKCSHCPLLFTTKSNCDRHLLRKHGNSATTITNDSTNNNNNNNNFMMRNVPERPFKCSNCPSSTFSTYSNLKKHMICKHGVQDDRQGYEAGSSEDEKNNSEKSDWEAQISQSKISPSGVESLVQNSDLPFKCHLCDHSFGERQDCLDHIRDKHVSEYELLMSKNALDANASTPDEGGNHDEDDEMRGKFPDYSNRKVICAFCMRRFWSAEDLRRHMRTHTGERPFSCDICRRRFTLKHSMLRHRKKHNVPFENDNGHSDEEEKLLAKSDNNNLVAKLEKIDDSDGNEGSDLISNLLGIRDRSIIEQVLTASADDAAKLLGVGRQE